MPLGEGAEIRLQPLVAGEMQGLVVWIGGVLAWQASAAPMADSVFDLDLLDLPHVYMLARKPFSAASDSRLRHFPLSILDYRPDFALVTVPYRKPARNCLALTPLCHRTFDVCALRPAMVHNPLYVPCS